MICISKESPRRFSSTATISISVLCAKIPWKTNSGIPCQGPPLWGSIAQKPLQASRLAGTPLICILNRRSCWWPIRLVLIPSGCDHFRVTWKPLKTTQGQNHSNASDAPARLRHGFGNPRPLSLGPRLPGKQNRNPLATLVWEILHIPTSKLLQLRKLNSYQLWLRLMF